MLKARPSSVNFRAHRAPWREHLQQTKIARGGAVRQSSAPSLNLCLVHMCFCLNLSCIPLIADTFYMPFLSVDRPKTGTARAVHATLYPGLSLVRCQARKHIPEYCISVLFHSRLGTTKTKAEFAMNVQALQLLSQAVEIVHFSSRIPHSAGRRASFSLLSSATQSENLTFGTHKDQHRTVRVATRGHESVVEGASASTARTQAPEWHRDSKTRCRSRATHLGACSVAAGTGEYIQIAGADKGRAQPADTPTCLHQTEQGPLLSHSSTLTSSECNQCSRLKVHSTTEPVWWQDRTHAHTRGTRRRPAHSPRR